jgi:hypothetical protein
VSSHINVEESFARSLAQCHKIDKSLEFYADIRKKWREGPSSPPNVAQNSSSSSEAVGVEGAPPTGACAKVASRLVTPTISVKERPFRGGDSGTGASREPIRAGAYPQGTPTVSSVREAAGDGEKTRRERQSNVVGQRKPSRTPLNDLSSLPPRREWRTTATREQPSVLSPVAGTARERESGNALRIRGPHTTAEKPTGEEKRVTKVPVPVPNTHLQSSSPFVPVQPKREAPKSREDQVTTFPVVHANPPLVKDKEKQEEFNDFDSIQQQDSDSKLVEPLSGAFGKPVLTGARPLLPPLPPSPSPEISREADREPLPRVPSVEFAAGRSLPTSQQSSCESDCVVRKKPVSPSVELVSEHSLPASQESSCDSDCAVRRKPQTTTHNDTVIARVLQAEEESRAGVALNRESQ